MNNRDVASVVECESRSELGESQGASGTLHSVSSLDSPGGESRRASFSTTIRWTEEENEIGLRMWNEGKSMIKIAKAVGRSPSAVWHWSQRHRLSKRGRTLASTRWTEEEEATIREMYMAGVLMTDIAAKTGRSIHGLYRWKISRGIPDREKNVRKFSDDQIKFIADNASTMTTGQMAKHLGFNTSSVLYNLRKLGLRAAMPCRQIKLRVKKPKKIRVARIARPKAIKLVTPKPAPTPGPKREFVRSFAVHARPPSEKRAFANPEQEIAAWLQTHEVTQCPAALVAPTNATLSQSDLAAMEEHHKKLMESAERQAKGKRSSVAAYIRNRALS